MVVNPKQDKVIEQTALQIIDDVKILLTDRHPFYGSLLMTVKLIADWDLKTLATNCIDTMYYNPNYVVSNKREHILFACIHEMNHIIRLHAKRLAARHQMLWNLATDYVINSDILASAASMKFDYDLKDGLFDRKYQDWMEEDVYDDLYAKNKNALDKLTGLFKPDNHGKWQLPTTQEEQQIREQVSQAAAIWEKSNRRGSLPAGMTKLIDKLRNPRISWVAQLRQFVGTAIQRTRYTWRKLRKTYLPVGVYKPSLHNPGIGRVVVAVDTSGSCSGLEMTFASEFRSLYDMIDEVTLIMADADVQDVIETKDILTALKEHGFKGGGGTSHVPVFNYLNDNAIRPDVMICFTDGYTEFPEQAPYFPVIWCMPEGTDVKVPWGMTVYIPQPDKMDEAVNF